MSPPPARFMQQQYKVHSIFSNAHIRHDCLKDVRRSSDHARDVFHLQYMLCMRRSSHLCVGSLNQQRPISLSLKEPPICLALRIIHPYSDVSVVRLSSCGTRGESVINARCSQLGRDHMRPLSQETSQQITIQNEVAGASDRPVIVLSPSIPIQPEPRD